MGEQTQEVKGPALHYCFFIFFVSLQIHEKNQIEIDVDDNICTKLQLFLAFILNVINFCYQNP